jgi:uridine kinase
METPQLGDSLVRLQPADTGNVDLLITWTLDPIAQGPYKHVPGLTTDQLREQLLFDGERRYFVIERCTDGKPLGRFYWRAWRFGRSADTATDWELNIFLADPADRGKGYGTSVQRLAAEHLASLPETRSIFAFTMTANAAERRALLKAGFREHGPMPDPDYPVELPAAPCVLYIRSRAPNGSKSCDSVARSVRIAQLAATIAAVNLNHPTRVAIDGVDGVGKTTLANELVGPLTRMGRPVIRASVDGFHQPRQARYRRGADSPEGYFLDSFDYAALLSQLLHPLGPGGTRRFRRAVFDYRSDRPVDVPPETAGADAILLFDGVFLQRAELAGVWDIRIWVDAPFEVTVPRAVSRDASGTDRASMIRAQYEGRYVPGQLVYMDQCRPKESADIVVNNADLNSPVLRYRRFGQAAQQRDGAVGAGTDD